MPTLVSIEKEDVPRQLGELQRMKGGQLADRYRELYGELTRSRNRGYLVRRLAWRIQELAEGGLPPSVLQRIEDLGDKIPERWRMRLAQREGVLRTVDLKLPPRDPRLPEVGTVLRRAYRGRVYEVRVVEMGFELDGKLHRSLTGVAKEITGHNYSGFEFFGIGGKRK